ncbi:MAG: helix-turn-helix domain-containing protein [Pyrinomonadaceae bacterium]
MERIHIERILAATGNNLSRGAEILGVTRGTLYNKMRKYQSDAK